MESAGMAEKPEPVPAKNWDPVLLGECELLGEYEKIKRCSDLFMKLVPAQNSHLTFDQLKEKLGQTEGDVYGGPPLCELYLYSPDGSGSETKPSAYRIVLAVEYSLHRKPRKENNHGDARAREWHLHVGLEDDADLKKDYEAVKDKCRDFLDLTPPRKLFVVGNANAKIGGGVDGLLRELDNDESVKTKRMLNMRVGRNRANYHYYRQPRHGEGTSGQATGGLGPGGKLARLWIKSIDAKAG